MSESSKSSKSSKRPKGSKKLRRALCEAPALALFLSFALLLAFFAFSDSAAAQEDSQQTLPQTPQTQREAQLSLREPSPRMTAPTSSSTSTTSTGFAGRSRDGDPESRRVLERAAEERETSDEDSTDGDSAAGDLAGASAVVLDRDGDGFVDLITVVGAAGCEVGAGPTVVFRDGDGTLGVVVANRAGVPVASDGSGISFGDSRDPEESPETTPSIPFTADSDLTGDRYTVERSSGITCAETSNGDPANGDSADESGDEAGGEAGDEVSDEDSDRDASNEDSENEDSENGDSGNGDSGNGGTEESAGSDDGSDDEAGEDSGATSATSNEGELDEERQDVDAGPLAGGTATGLDVLVTGDQNCGPNGEFICIDRIIIETESCEIVETEDLTVTLEDPGGLFRIRDDDNVSFSIDEDGTITADGLRRVRDTPNPNRAIIPIPVDPEDFELDDQPNDTFPIVSSTGIGGEGCRPADASGNDNNGNNGSNGGDSGGGSSNGGAASDGVIVETIPAKLLVDTGGPSLLLPLSALVIVGAGLLGFAFLRRR